MTLRRSVSPCLVLLLGVVLMVLNSCGEVTPLGVVPDAENSLITTDGRLFVSGSFNLYEITKSEGGAYETHALLETEYYFAGLDEYRGYIYGVRGNCGIKILYDGDPHLMIAGLSDISPGGDPSVNEAAFTVVPLDGMVMPNGLCIDTAGHLFIADTLGGKIYRFTIDADDPMNLDGPYDTGLTGLGSPNGILALNGVLYFTDGGAVKKTAIAADGRLGPVEKLYSGRVVLDDLTAYDDTLVVCDYMKGTVFQLSLQGKVLRETKTETFCFPSSVIIATGPLFDVDGLVVTEKGILYEPSSSFGNRAVLFTPDTL